MLTIINPQTGTVPAKVAPSSYVSYMVKSYDSPRLFVPFSLAAGPNTGPMT